MSFEHVAYLLLPEGEADALAVRADAEWRVPAEQWGRAAVVWGREPTWAPMRELAGFAARRERALRRLRRRPPAPLAFVGVHRWSYAFAKARYLPTTMARLRAGAVVELTREPARPRRLDAAARAAGVPERVGVLNIGAGGQVSAGVQIAGRPAILRVARTGSPVDPSRAAAALVQLAPMRLTMVPEVLGQGHDESASWTAESRLLGRPARALSENLLHAAVDFCLRLPRSSRPPLAFAEDIASLSSKLPWFAEALRALEARTAPVLASLPSVLRHGDLWRGNLLVDGGRLTGVVDWDAWRPEAVPGTDLLHLVASARALATRRGLAEVLAERPWEHPSFARAVAPYWAELEIEPESEVLAAIGVAWWAAQSAANLDRHPATRTNAEWVAGNVEPLLLPR